MKCKKRGCHEPIVYSFQDRTNNDFEHQELCEEHGKTLIRTVVTYNLNELTELRLVTPNLRTTIKRIKPCSEQ